MLPVASATFFKISDFRSGLTLMDYNKRRLQDTNDRELSLAWETVTLKSFSLESPNFGDMVAMAVFMCTWIVTDRGGMLMREFQ